jgi:hypothetical protein
MTSQWNGGVEQHARSTTNLRRRWNNIVATVVLATSNSITGSYVHPTIRRGVVQCTGISALQTNVTWKMNGQVRGKKTAATNTQTKRAAAEPK